MINAEQQQRIDYLCKQIEVETKPGKIAELARELNDLLDAKADRSPSSKTP